MVITEENSVEIVNEARTEIDEEHLKELIGRLLVEILTAEGIINRN